MKISVIRPAELGAAELTRWRDIQRATPRLASPFLAPEFTLAVGSVRPQARVAVLEEGAEIVGFFPFEQRSLRTGVPIGAWFSDCQGLVLRDGVAVDPLELLKACDLTVWEFNHLVAGQTHFEPYVRSHAPSPIMDLSGGFEQFLATLRERSGTTVRNIFRKQRKLEREVGPLRFEYESHDTVALRAVMAWKSAQYRRTGIADKFAQPWFVEIIDRLFATTTDTFSGVLSMVYVDDEPVAGHFGLRSSRAMAYWFPAFDTDYGRYSPGLFMNLLLAEAAAADGMEHVDLGTGPEEYKRWFRTGELTVGQGWVARPSATAALFSAKRSLTTGMRDAVKRNASLLRAAKNARAAYFRAREAARRHAGIREHADQPTAARGR